MKNFLPVILFAALAVVSCKKDNGSDPGPVYEGVTINGVTWSEYNVDAPGAFTAKAEDYGMFYQWNRKTAWLATGDDPVSSTGGTTWDYSTPSGDVWATANDPCPAGWRVPTHEEQAKLLDAAKVDKVWTTLNGVDGYRFIDKTTQATIFLPAAGNCAVSDGTHFNAGYRGAYWSGSSVADSAWSLYFGSDASWSNYNRTHGFSVRCVRP